MLPPAPVPDMLYVCIDGTGVPVVAAETAGRDGKDGDGTAHTREVKIAVAFTQTSTDAEGRPVRDLASSSYVATFASAPEFGTLMAARRAMAPPTSARWSSWVTGQVDLESGQHFPQLRRSSICISP